MFKNWIQMLNIRSNTLIVLIIPIHVTLGMLTLFEVQYGVASEISTKDDLGLNAPNLTKSGNANNSVISPILLVPSDAVKDNVYFVWSSNKTGNFEIFFAKSTDSGRSVNTAINLSNSPNAKSENSLIRAEGENVYVTWWEKFGNGTSVPLLRSSNDNGETFGKVINLGSLIKVK